MKIPEPRKLPSGSWNIRLQVDGQSYSITKSTKKACRAEAAALKTGLKSAPIKTDRTLTKAIDHYIDDRKNVLSPATIRGYRCIQNQRFSGMMNRDISAISQEQWQRAVNLEAKICSAKTLKNAWGFVSTVIRRTVPFLIPQLRDAVMQADKSDEYIIRCAPNVLRYNINKACRTAGLPEVGTHGLRRSFASLAYHLGVPEEVTMKAGGWADIYTMRKIYTKVSDKDISDQGEKYVAFFEKIGTENCNEIENT